MTGSNSHFQNYPQSVALDNDEIHIWSAKLDIAEARVKKWQLYLSTEELQRAHRFYFVKDQNHFIVARGVLRKILSLYTNKQPYEIRFEYNKYGKPFLTRESGGDLFHFNLSHSSGLVLYAITSKREVGIDVEYLREDFSDLEIANRFFSPDEVSVLRSLRPEDQTLAFFLGWTRKEAFIKAKGEGLSIPLDQFDVSLIPGQPATLLRTRYDRLEVSHWMLFNIDRFSGYAAALAVKGHDLRLKYLNNYNF